MVQADPSRAIIRRQVQSVEFGFYTDKDVRSRSVCEVTSSQALDAFGTPLPHGLYDPRMGPTDPKSPPCITCGCLFQTCPGHAGHVELSVPLFNPLLFGRLLNLLKIKCYHCHKIRWPKRQVEICNTKFFLLEQGRVLEALELDQELAQAVHCLKENNSNKSTDPHVLAATMDQVLREKRTSRRLAVKETSVERRLKRELVKHVMSSCMQSKKCEQCGAFSPTIRHDASNKIFQAPLSHVHARVNRAEGIKFFKSALVDQQQQVEEYDSDDTQDNNEEEEEAMVDSGRDVFMHALEVEAQVKLTWLMEPSLCHNLFGGGDSGWQIFFLRAIPVPPSRFRPPMVLGTMTVEHSQNHYLNKMLLQNDLIRTLLASEENQETRAISAWIDLQTTVNCYMDSTKDPSATGASGNAPPGIRQILEKKEGIFRKHMMGKRVDYACRSVISPDPYVGTNEIGIPLHFAKTLTYPTPVTGLNIIEMRQLVKRGKFNYPGASWVEFPDGRRVDLAMMDAHKREAVAARMLAMSKGGDPPVIVGRQLRNGDMMLVNRQPTLHKPGIMAHYVRILHSPTQKTIRMHYANCNTYNADFDGDEMNCHFPQNDVARAESEFIAATDLQFIVPTDGSPLRGLIQDHVDSGVKLTCKDTFLEKWEYQQLLFAALASLPGLEVIRSDTDIELVPPAICKPRELWTGKQVISTLLNHLRKGNDVDGLGECTNDFPGISVEGKTKTPETAFGGAQQEHLVLIRDGELLRGVLDKAAFGATEYSLVHAVYEAYGPKKAGLLLNALGRLFTAYLQYYSGHSCRMEDLVLTTSADRVRRTLVQRSYNVGARAAKAWADSEGGKVQIKSVKDQPGADKPLKPHEAASASAKIGQLLSGSEGNNNFAALDGYMQSQLNPLASEIIKACLPSGLAVPFPANTFSLMVTTGAKGSTVNQSQVSCSLGQQALEGRRVPRMSSGRTLPSFAPYDPHPRADGFIADRFLTGVRPQEYYFHCMAGREGLVDTAVKTSRSGYLQRCLVKHLEELKVCYDSTVRDGEGGVIQFLYGEDGLDPTKAAYLDCSSRTFAYIARNREALKRRNSALPGATLEVAAMDADRAHAVSYNAPNLLKKGSFVQTRRLRVGSRWIRGALCRGWFSAVITKTHKHGKEFDLMYLDDNSQAKRVPLEVDLEHCGGKHTSAASSLCTLIKPAVRDPILSDTVRDDGKYRVGSSGACVSEKVAESAMDALRKDGNLQRALKSAVMTRDEFSSLIAAKYGTALCAPGEAVGCIAAQSVGEPSTQMTLNTFHLAGSGANVTLGIPRLREIIMTASKELKTPTMSVPLHYSVSEKQALKLTRFFTRLSLMEVISSHGGITVNDSLVQGAVGSWERAYQVTLKLHPAERIKEAFGLRLQDIAKVVAKSFMPKLADVMKRELRRSAADGDAASMEVQGGDASEYIELPSLIGKDDRGAEIEDESEDEDAAEEVGAEDGVMGSRFSHKREMESYGDMDDDDKALAKQTTKESHLFGDDSSDDEDDDAAVVTDDEDRGGFTTWEESGNAVKVDTRRNSLILQPLRVDPSARPLLMVGLVERAATVTLVRSRPRISEAYVNEEEGGRGRCLQTAGVNFEEFWKLDNVNHNQLASNDIWAVRCAYGVEAARNNIVEQIRSVFGAYGISVDPRHLSLIADYMTFEGGFKAMNRIGMSDIGSPFLQMSFETTAQFMTEAALSERKEELVSPSANIVLGRPIRHGTGAFELLAK